MLQAFMIVSFQEALRGAADLASDLCTRIIHWRRQTIEISVLSLILWVSALLAVAVALSYFNASIFKVN